MGSKLLSSTPISFAFVPVSRFLSWFPLVMYSYWKCNMNPFLPQIAFGFVVLSQQ